MSKNHLIELKAENGIVEKYEILDIIGYESKVYVVLYPEDENDTEVVIMRVEDSENPKESIANVETDENIVQHIYAEFKERNKEKIKFVD